MSSRTKIERKSEAVIAALLTEPSHAAAAAKAGIGEATLQRWLRNPKFVNAYRIARRSIVEAAVGQVQQASAQAVEVLTRNMNCGNPSVEVRAALAILDKAMIGVELIDVTTRLEELEGILNKKAKSIDSIWGTSNRKAGDSDEDPQEAQQLSQAIQEREPEGQLHIVVVVPLGVHGEMRAPGIYSESEGSATYVYEGAKPDPKVMAELSELIGDEMLIICERGDDSENVEE